MPIFGGYVSSLEGIFSESMNGWFFNGKLVGKYTVRPMDPVGIYKLVGGWFNPSEKIFVKLDHLPKVRDENTKCVRNNHCFQNDAIMCGNCFFPNDLWSQLLFFCFKKKRFHKNPKTYILGCPPAQDSSHHQDWFLLFFAGDPETKPSFATVSFHRESFRKTPPLLPTSCWVRSQPGVTGLLAVSHGDGWNKNRWWMGFLFRNGMVSPFPETFGKWFFAKTGCIRKSRVTNWKKFACVQLTTPW